MGSEFRPLKIWKHLKSGFFKDQISNGPVFKWWGFNNDYSFSPNHLKSGCFCRDFKMVFDNMADICQDGWASGFQINFEIQTICNPQPLLDNSKSRLGRISHPHCTAQLGHRWSPTQMRVPPYTRLLSMKS